MRCRVRGQQGQALIELSVLILVVMLLGLAAVQFGILYGVRVRVEHAAREGARYAAVHVLDPNAQASIINHTIDAVGGDLKPALTAADVSVTTPQGAVGDRPVVVTVTYNCPLTIPLMRSILPNPTRMQVRALMRIEG